MTPIQSAILAASFHRTRKCYPEWTADELARRCGQQDVADDLCGLEMEGLMESARTKDMAFWRATEKGKGVGPR